MRVGIVGQKDNGRAAATVAAVAGHLDGMGVELAVDEVTASQVDDDWPAEAPPVDRVSEPIEAMSGTDLVVSVGGDGTFLFAARSAGSTPVMGINLGEVGFLNAVAPEDAVDAVEREVRDYRGGGIETRDMPRLQASGDDWDLPAALNEVVVQGPRRGHGGGASVEVSVDGSVYTSGHADGVLVATPAGSTAYNLSERGPLVHPDVPGFVVNGMSAAESMPPLTVGTDATVTVRVENADGGYVVSDGRVHQAVDPPARVRIEHASDPVRIAGPPLDFFAALDKLERKAGR
ncbi:NAD(+) kinase [Halobacteriales archaeon QH_8_68_33]|nr:MAG: NAD(+) kinase [Halobacteriales archaeon QH_8_68_33]